MTRFVVDASAVLHLAGEGIEVPATHTLLAPTLLRSQTLSALHEAVQRGELPADPGVRLSPPGFGRLLRPSGEPGGRTSMPAEALAPDPVRVRSPSARRSDRRVA